MSRKRSWKESVEHFRKMHKIIMSGVVLTGAIVLSIGSVASAATSKPSLTFSAVRGTIGGTASIKYSSGSAPGSTTTWLQQQQGTAKIWRDVVMLRRSVAVKSAIVSLTNVGLNKFRIATLRRRTLVEASPARSIKVYGPVTFSELCNGVGAVGGQCDPSVGNAQFGSTIFSYNLADPSCGLLCGETTPAPSENTLMKVTGSTCDSMTVTIAVNGGVGGVSGTLSVIRSDANPQTLTAQAGQTATATFQLDSEPWYLEDNADGNVGMIMDVSKLLCYSTTGLRSTTS